MALEKTFENDIDARAQHVFDVMAQRTSEHDMKRLRDAYEFAKNAHQDQKRRSGEPYITHPIAVATIAAEELMLSVNPVIAAFLHDVVEDTPFTIDDIEQRFGSDVAFLVTVVTKKKNTHCDESKQVENYRQLLNSIEFDIRALLVKIADRLHNMRTLSSMRPDKQMKIAGETDYLYAPLANRLGLYNIKTELENLSMQYRCPHDYDEMVSLISRDQMDQSSRLARFCDQIKNVLASEGIDVDVWIEYRKPCSVWRKMRKFGDDFNHLKYRHFTEIVFKTPSVGTEKDLALRIYSILTNHFKEKPGGFLNYIDSPKENGYQSIHVKLLPDFGRWQEVHISSERMVRDSQLGCIADRNEDNIKRWIEKFRNILRELTESELYGDNFIENVVSSFYNDDIMTFATNGHPIVLPQRSTVLDFAYEMSPSVGRHAKYARVNGFLSSIKAPLRRGDVVEVFTDEDVNPQPDWLDNVVTYKAKKEIRGYLQSLPTPNFLRCQHCNPIPSDEVIGFRGADGRTTIHKRDCPVAVKLASQHGEDIQTVTFAPDETLYPVTIVVTAVDRYHLFIDLVSRITNDLHLTLNSFNTETVDSIVKCTISFGVHSYGELQSIIHHISAIDGVDEVKQQL